MPTTIKQQTQIALEKQISTLLFLFLFLSLIKLNCSSFAFAADTPTITDNEVIPTITVFAKKGNDSYSSSSSSSSSEKISSSQLINSGNSIIKYKQDATDSHSETVYLVKNKNFFEKVVTSPMGFMMYKTKSSPEKFFLTISYWKDGEHGSSHGVIRDTMSAILKDTSNITELEGGYIMPFKGKYLIYQIRSEDLYKRQHGSYGNNYGIGCTSAGIGDGDDGDDGFRAHIEVPVCKLAQELSDAFEKGLDIKPIYPNVKDYNESMACFEKSFKPGSALRYFWSNLASK